MESPIRIRLKPVEFDGMQFTGTNDVALVEWMRHIDLSIHSYSSHRDYPVVPFKRRDGSSPLPAVDYLEIFTDKRSFRVYFRNWVLRNAEGLLTVHNELEIQRKYEGVPK